MMKFMSIFLVILPFLFGCDGAEASIEQDPQEQMYFPPTTTNFWETTTFKKVGWNEDAVPDLTQFLIANGTKAFMILYKGRIVMEEYFNGHTASDTWQWNSAGKTLVTATVGIAQEEGLLNIDAKVSDYLGVHWTSEPVEKENLIHLKHLLSMTSGIDDTREFISKANMTYLADAGMRWSYHNVFQKLMDVITRVSLQDFESYFNQKIKDKLGMDGFWNNGIIFTIYHSTARSMARFGLLALNKGAWDGEQIVNESFFLESTSSSQTINPAYGYLWWLNGKNTFMIPGEQTVFSGSLVPNAPNDMVAGMGASEQRMYVVPSKDLVVIRMGNGVDPDNATFAVSGFDNSLWQKLNAVIND
ncbi:beta-lactamase family protein [Flavobacteriaceae bacterium F08102]|nr:beta-lactamase family protein [Flavobacteriaceae bacterium F08102]